ncbi:hypothetical protein KIL84_007260 [Mauremys mutica]|uniref:Uncharacterized protein n=1 Tax=Mauremys mutica TaxID=74926 RepID=A0A9D4APY6_9SAUR|nr:hypothetical protein KIL84_007260 [Mauremys mutica]
MDGSPQNWAQRSCRGLANPTGLATLEGIRSLMFHEDRQLQPKLLVIPMPRSACSPSTVPLSTPSSTPAGTTPGTHGPSRSRDPLASARHVRSLALIWPFRGGGAMAGRCRVHSSAAAHNHPVALTQSQRPARGNGQAKAQRLPNPWLPGPALGRVAGSGPGDSRETRVRWIVLRKHTANRGISQGRGCIS